MSCHTFSSRFKSKLTRPLRNLHCLLGKPLRSRLWSCWKVKSSPSVWWKADWTRFQRILPVLSSIPFLFYPGIAPQSLTIAIIPITWCRHHYAWTYGEWYSVICCNGFAPNIILCILDKKLIALPHFCRISLVPRCKKNACFEIFVFCTGFLLFTLSIRLVLWSNYNIVDPSSVFSNHSH